MSLRVDIQNKIVDLLKADGMFYPVAYDSSTDKATMSVEPVSPASVKVNETGSRFEIDQRHGLALRRNRTAWAFDAHADFHTEVSAEVFEALVANYPEVLPKSLTDGGITLTDLVAGVDEEAEGPIDLVTVALTEPSGRKRQIRLHLTSTRATHPPTQGDSRGSSFVFTFMADLGRL